MWPRSLSARMIGAGEVSLSRSAVRGVDASELARAVHATLVANIDLIEVAPDEDAERLVGDALRALRLRDRALPMIRVRALSEEPSGSATRDVLRERLPARYIQERVERALRATRLDVLPIVAIELRAAWRTGASWPELVDACARLVRDGKVIAYAAYIERIEDDTHELLDETWLDAISVPYSLCERGAEALLERAIALRASPGTSPSAASSSSSTSPHAAASPRASAPVQASPHAEPQTPRSTGSLDADPALAAAAARDPHIAAVLAAQLSSGDGLGMPTTSSSTTTAHALVDPRLAANDPVVAAALARDPKLAAALGITLPRSSARDVAVLARRPLAGGALAGTLGPGAKLRKDDDRALDAKTLERIAVGVARLAAFVKETPPAARSCDAAKLQLERNVRPEHVECATLPELALRVVLDRGAIPMPRLHHHEHVVDALAATISPPLPRDLMEKLDI